ncbi:MAG: amidohydrolase [Acidimicrobiales bacterium]|nr:amidohydrolase [Acidimicrobiales bacterium]MYB82892.1 amidohydrolase [Acidimicrobiales bacterium]MYI12989.1 amidohydrolase [Acidimicrobiales bacterium]
MGSSGGVWLARRMPDDNNEPDLVLRGGQIVTACNGLVVESLAVRANRVSAAGTDVEIGSLAGPRTRVIDLDGRTVVPGINDSHVHLGFFGAVRPPLAIDVSFPTVQSTGDIAHAIRHARPTGPWIRGIGWDIGYLDDLSAERPPHRRDLDQVSEQIPVALRDFSGHQLWVNSRALQIAGIGRNTPDPSGGVIVRDSDGEPTGILQESATSLVASHMPPLSEHELNQALDTARDLMHAEGITSVTDAALGPGGNTFEGGAAGERFLRLLGERAGPDDFSLRATVLMAFSPLTSSCVSDVEEHLHTFVPPSNKPGWFQIAGVKLFADGVPPNKTAWVNQEYCGGGFGCLTIVGECDEQRLADLDAMVGLIHDAGHQIGVHVTGDRAIEATVKCLVAAQRRNPLPDPRHYLIHADLASPEVLKLVALHGYGASMQPAIKWTIANLMRDLLGKERADYQWPMRTGLDAGVRVTSSSDAPITYPSWRQGVAAAVLRESKASGETYGPAERISLLEALETYTVNGAWQDRAEGWKGDLTPGKVADFCILDDRVLDIDPRKIPDTQIATTVVDGRVVFGDFPGS